MKKSKQTSKKNKSSIWDKMNSSKAYERNLGTMRLLVGDKRFQEAVAQFRKELGIPEAGFGHSKEQDEARQIWLQELEKKSDEVLESDWFLKHEKDIREKPLQRRSKKKLIDLLYAEKIPLNKLKTVGRTIIDSFDLPLHFLRCIIVYVVSGVVDAPLKNYEPALLPPHTSLRNTKVITINIYEQLAPDELEELKHYLNWIGANKLHKFRILTKIGKEIEIESNGIEDLSLSADKIRDTRRNLKELREKRFNRRGKK